MESGERLSLRARCRDPTACILPDDKYTECLGLETAMRITKVTFMEVKEGEVWMCNEGRACYGSRVIHFAQLPMEVEV